MRRIIICCSLSASDEVLAIQKQLEAKGFVVEIPWGVQQYRDNNYTHVSRAESAQNKKDNDLIKRYYKKIQEHDVVLVVNTDKNGVANYIGGNTFLEMSFAHVLDKPLYVLNPLPDVSYRDELEAMSPVILKGNLDLIQ
jgi:hypothetical protein